MQKMIEPIINDKKCFIFNCDCSCNANVAIYAETEEEAKAIFDNITWYPEEVTFDDVDMVIEKLEIENLNSIEIEEV